MSDNPRTVADGLVVSVRYTVRDSAGELLGETPADEPLVYVHGRGEVMPGLERGLEGALVGETRSLRVPPELGFGELDSAAISEVSRGEFPAELELEVGMQFGAEDAEGEEVTVWITAIEGQRVTINANHPLAGETLVIEARVLELREQTKEELEHGHLHGPGGHQH